MAFNPKLDAGEERGGAALIVAAVLHNDAEAVEEAINKNPGRCRSSCRTRRRRRRW